MFKKFLTRRSLFVLLAATALLLMGIRGFFAYAKQPQSDTATVEKTNITQAVTASGEIESEDEVELKFPVSGKLTNLAVKKNDRVSKWGYIGSLDLQDLQKRMEKSLRDYSKERDDFDQNRQVTYKDQVITDTVKRILEKDQWDLDKAVMDVELANIAKKNSSLYSPIAGVVTKVHVHEGTSILAATTPIVTVADPDKLVFVARIGEADVAEVAEGQKATVTLDAFEGKKFSGTVTEVDYAATVSSTGGKTYQVKIALDDLNKVKLDMSGDAEITTVSHPNALVIPRVALQGQNGKKYLEVLKGKEAEKKEVETGIKGAGGIIEILSGVNPGEKVIIPNPGK